MSEAAAGYFPAADAARRIGEAFMAAARSDPGDGRAVRSKAQARAGVRRAWWRGPSPRLSGTARRARPTSPHRVTAHHAY